MAITVPLGVPLFFLATLATGSLATVWSFAPISLAALAAAGVLHFVWGRYCNYRATRAIGTNLVAPVQQVNLVVTLCLALWLLGEQLTPLRILGIALVLLGPAIISRARHKVAGERDVSAETARSPATLWRAREKDRKSTRLNPSHQIISYAAFRLQ